MLRWLLLCGTRSLMAMESRAIAGGLLRWYLTIAVSIDRTKLAS
jgi:hypothetical protein